MDTLKVRMNVSIASSDWSFVPGEKVELDKDLAEAWLASGHAVKIDGEKVNTKSLPAGLEYLGFGVYQFPSGQRFHGFKKDAIEALANDVIVEEVVEGGEEFAAGLKGNNTTDAGANQPSGSESTPEG